MVVTAISGVPELTVRHIPARSDNSGLDLGAQATALRGAPVRLLPSACGERLQHTAGFCLSVEGYPSALVQNEPVIIVSVPDDIAGRGRDRIPRGHPVVISQKQGPTLCDLPRQALRQNETFCEARPTLTMMHEQAVYVRFRQLPFSQNATNLHPVRFQYTAEVRNLLLRIPPTSVKKFPGIEFA